MEIEREEHREEVEHIPRLREGLSDDYQSSGTREVEGDGQQMMQTMMGYVNDLIKQLVA